MPVASTSRRITGCAAPTGCATVSAGAAAAATSRRMSFIGSTLRTRGTTSKLFGGGGEVVNHSSVLPRHGSLPAFCPFLRLQITLATAHDHADRRG